MLLRTTSNDANKAGARGLPAAISANGRFCRLVRQDLRRQIRVTRWLMVEAFPLSEDFLHSLEGFSLPAAGPLDRRCEQRMQTLQALGV